MEDSKEYKDKKSFYSKIITLYGRNVVKEILMDNSIDIHKVHLSSSNKIDSNIENIESICKKRDIEIAYHDKKQLSRISKNSKQDQGVAIDIISKTYQNASDIKKLSSYKMIALDGIQNPQNLGMIVRSCAAGDISGIILPKNNSAKISPLVMKASAGTLFKLPIYFCDTLESALSDLGDANIIALDLDSKESIFKLDKAKKEIFVLGSESEGISDSILKLSNKKVFIPMNRDVESLNVAVTASIIAFNL